MSSNYPPGVTGNEYAIAGPDREWVDYRECPTVDATLRTLSPRGIKELKYVLDLLTGPKKEAEFLASVAVAGAHLRVAILDVEEVDLDSECPFAGDVELQAHEGVESWDCPVCRAAHESDADYADFEEEE